MREGQISINTRTKPERYLLCKHNTRINTNIFAFTCCVQLCYLDSRLMSTASVVGRLTDSKQINFMVWYVEIKCQLDATEVFIADLIACSTCFGHHYAHHLELKSIIQWLLPVVFSAMVFFK